LKGGKKRALAKKIDRKEEKKEKKNAMKKLPSH